MSSPNSQRDLTRGDVVAAFVASALVEIRPARVEMICSRRRCPPGATLPHLSPPPVFLNKT